MIQTTVVVLVLSAVAATAAGLAIWRGSPGGYEWFTGHAGVTGSATLMAMREVGTAVLALALLAVAPVAGLLAPRRRR